MRFIQKREEPAAFIRWKQQVNEHWQPTWENFQKPEKPLIHNSLIQEQGHICCYCGQRIILKTSHIEHFRPRALYPDLKLAYDNFLASCPGYSEDETVQNSKPAQEFCGQYKSNWYDPELMISPLQPNCTTYFRYTVDGEMRPTQEPARINAAKETIDRLNLNHPKLKLLREDAIEGILQGIETLSDDDLRQLIDGYDLPDASGQYTPFCAAVIYTLRQFLPA